MSPLVSPFFFGSVKSSHLRVNQIRPDQTLALPPVYFGNGLALFGIPIRPFQADITIPHPRGGMAHRIPRFPFSVRKFHIMVWSLAVILPYITTSLHVCVSEPGWPDLFFPYYGSCFYQLTRSKVTLPLLVASTFGYRLRAEFSEPGTLLPGLIRLAGRLSRPI